MALEFFLKIESKVGSAKKVKVCLKLSYMKILWHFHVVLKVFLKTESKVDSAEKVGLRTSSAILCLKKLFSCGFKSFPKNWVENLTVLKKVIGFVRYIIRHNVYEKVMIFYIVFSIKKGVKSLIALKKLGLAWNIIQYIVYEKITIFSWNFL